MSLAAESSRGPAALPAPTALRAYGSVRGATWRDSARLCFGYGLSVFQKLVRPQAYSCVGAAMPGRPPLTVSVAGFRARVRPGTNDLDLLVHHEPKTREWFRVRPGDFVVDVGAHIGLYTLLAARSAAHVIAFEPDPENFRMLQENVDLNGFTNVELVPGAVSRSAGWVEVVPAAGTNRGTSSVRRPIGEEGAPASITGWVAVRCNSLDRSLGPRALSRIDWLKVDVEGHELEVLAGAPATLARTQHLVLEVTEDHANEGVRMAEAAGLTYMGEEPGTPAANFFFARGGQR